MAVPAYACDLCSVYSAAQAHGDIGKGFFAGVSEQFTHFGTVQERGREIENPAGQYLDSSISQLFAGYNFNDRFSLQFNLPLLYRSFQRPVGFEMDRGTESGNGDAALIGNWRVLNHEEKHRTFAWNLLGGIKLPTGSSDRIAEEFREVEVPGAPESGIHGHDLTLGSGSYDGILGTSVFARYERWFFTASLQYSIRTEGDFNYRFADDLFWIGGPGRYIVLDEAYTLAVRLNVAGEHKELDRFQGVPASDTGITAVYVGPQIALTWAEKLSAELAVDLPVSMENTALQIVPDYRIRAGVTWHF